MLTLGAIARRMNSMFYNGPAMVSTGSGVRVIALGNVEAVGLGEPGRRRQKM